MYQKILPPFAIKSLDTKGNFVGYASVFDWIDHQGDRVASGAFAKSLERWKSRKCMPKMLWQHQQSEPIGKWQFIGEDQTGLYVEGCLLLEVDRARSAYALMKEGVLDGLSIGYEVRTSFHDSKSKARVLTEVDVHEISLVTFAANEKAKVHHVKSWRGECEVMKHLKRLNQLTTLTITN